MSYRKTCTLIGSDKGGVGKSFIAQLMVLAHDKGGIPLTVCEIDHQRKLTSILKERVDVSLDASPSLATASRDRFAAEAHFNQAYAAWTEKDSLTDLGANVTTGLLEWARVNDVAGLAEEDGVQFRFVAVATPDDQAIHSATVALDGARRSFGADAELFLILNDVSGGTGFLPYETTDEWRRLMALQRTHGVRVIRIPLCDSLILEWGRGMRFTILDILQNERDEIARIQAKAKLDRLALRTHVRRLTEWVQSLQQELQPLFASPEDGHFREAAE